MPMSPVHTKIALLVSLMSLGWSSAGAANETLVAGPLAPPEPATPFGTSGWPENWSFDLPAATRSADGQSTVAVPADTARRPKGRFKTGAAALSFQDYPVASQRYVCLDVETGVLARTASGCRVPTVLPDGALAAAEASALFFGSPDKRRTAGESAAAGAPQAAGGLPVDAPLQDPIDDLSAARATAQGAAAQDRPARRLGAAAEEATATPPALARSTIRPDLDGFHEACPFSLPDDAALAQSRDPATLTEPDTAKPAGKRAAKPAKTAKAPAATPAAELGKVKASKAQLRSAAAQTPASKRKVSRTQVASNPAAASAAGSGSEQARPQHEVFDETPARASAPAAPDKPAALSEAVRSATQAIADLRFIHEEDPFLLADANVLEQQAAVGVVVAQPTDTRGAGAAADVASAPPLPADQGADSQSAGSAPRLDRLASAEGPAIERRRPSTDGGSEQKRRPTAPMRQEAEASPAAVADDLTIPALSGAYPFWLPGDVAATMTPRSPVFGAGPGSAQRKPVDTVPLEIFGIVLERTTPTAARQTPPAVVLAEATVAPAIVETAQPPADAPSLDAGPVEVYGLLADEYAAAVDSSGPALAEAGSPSLSANDEGVEVPQGASTLEAGPVEVYGLLADEYAAIATSAEEMSGALAAETPSAQPDDRHSPRRVEVDAAADIGRATVDLLAALEHWVAQVARAEAMAGGPVASPKPIDAPSEGLFAKGSIAVAEAALDGVRGGFDDGSGLRVSFGIERAVYINGSLVTTTNFNVADLGKVSGGNAVPAAAAERPDVGLVLIQNGTGNFVQPGIAQTAAGTVIQNTLNNQNISSVTLLNASVNSLQMFKGLDLHSTLRNVITSAVPR